MASVPILFEDNFEIEDVDPDGKKFDRVSRVIAKGEAYEMDMVLDINSELYPLEVGDKCKVLLANTLKLDGSADGSAFNQSYEPNLADSYDYVMHGKVFKIDQKRDAKNVQVYASFGGLLMSLKGQYDSLQKLELDMLLYILLRKVAA